jgi:hypothetical protein
MGSHASNAAADYNANIQAIRDASIANNQDTIVSVLELGYGRSSLVRTVVSHASVTALTPIARSDYSTDGMGTPLWDSVGDAITQLENIPKDHTVDPTTAFMVIVTTDGGENSSRRWTSFSIKRKIEKLIATDKWSFVFRVPRGHKHTLLAIGIPEGNILEWDTHSSHGMEQAQAATTASYSQFYTMRSAGITRTQKFYADLSTVKSEDVEKKLIDLSKGVQLLPVAKDEDGREIRTFIEQRLGKTLKKGAAFYQLTKSEEIQPYKQIMIRDKTTNAIYGGDEARTLLGLPRGVKIRLAPDQLGNFDVFVQSTSINRKLSAGTQVLYFEAAGI